MSAVHRFGERRIWAVLVIAAMAASPPAAAAHGPCACLEPASGPPGTKAVASPGAYKIVFNPDRTDLQIGPKDLWKEHRPALAPKVVFRRTYRYSDLPLREPVVFRVPAAPPGRYLVAIYDGSEGGSHYTWEHFRVTRSAAVGAPARADRSTDRPVLALVGAGLLLAAVLVGVVARYGRRRA